jgi:hypothetical protein
LGLANVLQCFFAQKIGIAFTGFDKRDELRAATREAAMVAFAKSKRRELRRF